jgi:hypothetical protein
MPVGTAVVEIAPILTGMVLGAVLVRGNVWKLRLHASRWLERVPDRVVPLPLRVMPPPDEEYLGVWELSPEEARTRLTAELGFKQIIRAYLHAYECDDEIIHEVASCAYRPNGFLGGYQLHVRLFPRPDGQTDVWCHWERNPNVSPIAHLKRDGYDPIEGKRRFEDLLDETTAIAKA